MKNNANKNIETIFNNEFYCSKQTIIMNILKDIGYKPDVYVRPYHDETSYTLDRVADIIEEFLEFIKENEIIVKEDGQTINY
jgi:hypothetical protein